MRNGVTTVEKINFHLEGFFRSIFTMILISSFCWISLTSFSHLYQKYSPVNWWYLYDEINPVIPSSDSINYEKYMSFVSTTHRLKEMDMQWDDTLHCKTTFGHTTKIATQIWKERVLPKNKFEKIFWEWNIRKFKPYYTECQIKGIIIGTTDLGYKKVSSYETKWWKITK